MHSKYAFSLVELMVAVGIVGVLVTLAIPRYHSFIVQARRGEAKSNLSHIISLQKVYKIDYFSYYAGSPMREWKGIGYKDGYGRTGEHACDADTEVDKGLCNHLGFRPDAINELRYLYQVSPDGKIVTASAASDDDGYWIYPDCNGDGRSECGYPSGDALQASVKGSKPSVCRNITKYCPEDASIVVTPPPPPPMPTPVCTSTTTVAWGSIDTSQICSTEFGTQYGTKREQWTGDPSCTADIYTEVTRNVSGTEDCNGCVCPDWPSMVWPSIDTSTTCKGTNYTQAETQTRVCTGSPIPPATSCPNTHSVTRLVPGEKNCTCEDLNRPQPVGGCTSVEQWVGFPTCRCQCRNSEPVGGCPADRPWDTSFCACNCPLGSACPVNRPLYDASNCACVCGKDVASCDADGNKSFDPVSCTCYDPDMTPEPDNPYPCPPGAPYNKTYWVNIRWVQNSVGDWRQVHKEQMRCCQGDMVTTTYGYGQVPLERADSAYTPPCGCKPLEYEGANNTCHSYLQGKGRNCLKNVFNEWLGELGKFRTTHANFMSSLGHVNRRQTSPVFHHEWGTISSNTANPAEWVHNALFVWSYMGGQYTGDNRWFVCPPYAHMTGDGWTVSDGPSCMNLAEPPCTGADARGQCQVNWPAFKTYLWPRLFNGTSNGGEPACQ